MGEIGTHHQGPADLLLGAVAQRMVTPTSYVWQDQEDDRVAGAVLEILVAALDAADLAHWLDPARELLAG